VVVVGAVVVGIASVVVVGWTVDVEGTEEDEETHPTTRNRTAMEPRRMASTVTGPSSNRLDVGLADGANQPDR